MKSLPALLLATQALLPVYDRLSPWELGVRQLSSMGVTTRLCVGAFSHAVAAPDGAVMTQRGRTYVVIRSGESWPRIVNIVGIEGVAISSTVTGPVGLLAWLTVLLGCGYLVWRWWIRPCRAGGLDGLRRAI